VAKTGTRDPGTRDSGTRDPGTRVPGTRDTGTPERMILVAERLFAERGIGAVSLREIGAEAGQRNNSAAQYHFGSKQGLVDAIVEYRMGPINARRLALLAALDATGRGDDLRGLVEALVEPFAEHGATTGVTWYARFIERAMTEPATNVFGSMSHPVMRGLREVVQRIDRALADLPDVLRGHRLQLAGDLLVHAVAERERTHRQGAPAALLAADLIDATVGILTAPVSADTVQELHAVQRHPA
jgi:AcrR family transcriptional regulator